MPVSRRVFMNRSAAGVLALAALPALAACGAAQSSRPAAPAVKFGDSVSITFWHTQTGTNADALAEMVNKFNESNGKNITLKSEYQGNYTQLYQKIMASIQAGSPPDVAVAYESMVAEYMKAKAVVDLEDYARKGPQAFSDESLKDIFPQYIETNRYSNFGNKLLSFPFTKSLAIHYYNEDMFRDAGQAKLSAPTFDEFKKQCAALTKKDADKTAVYAENISVDTSYIDAYTYANGGELLNKENTKVRFTDGPMVEIFEMWGDLVKNGQAYVAKGFDYQADFGAGKVAGFHQSSTGRPFIRQAVDENPKKFKWGIGMIPQKNPSKPVTVMFGANVAVFKSTDLKQAASWEWVKFFTDKDQTVTWAIKSSYMPIRQSAASHPALKDAWEKDPQGKQAFDLTQYARPEPNITAWQDIRDILANALTAVITGKATAKAALDDAAKQANSAIEEKS